MRLANEYKQWELIEGKGMREREKGDREAGTERSRLVYKQWITFYKAETY